MKDAQKQLARTSLTRLAHYANLEGIHPRGVSEEAE